MPALIWWLTARLPEGFSDYFQLASFSDYFQLASKGTTLIWLTDICAGKIPVYIELNKLKTAILLA